MHLQLQISLEDVRRPHLDSELVRTKPWVSVKCGGENLEFFGCAGKATDCVELAMNQHQAKVR